MATDGEAITWIGHATVGLELGGVTFLTDPALTGRLAHLRRHREVDLEAVSRVDVVLISHIHHDHLHLPSLRLLPPDVTYVVPRGAARLLTGRGLRKVVETAAGETRQCGPVEVRTVPAAHSDRRGPHSRVVASPVGYVLRSGGHSVYFAGDTDLFDELAGLAPVDVALLPIWGWGPSVGHGHLDPERAAEAVSRLQARWVIPIHWGTYSPYGLRRRPPVWLDDPLGRFRDELAAVGLADRLLALAPGQRMVAPWLDGVTSAGPGAAAPPPRRPTPS